ncbi:MAG TPA: hypothetical protein VMU25_00085 [Candidatus Paceibacterota bacterium]|nr:hypothetical protein [Candidatus Paceibacterota bacterium]
MNSLNVLKENWGVIIGVLVAFLVGLWAGFTLGSHGGVASETVEVSNTTIATTSTETTQKHEEASNPEVTATNDAVVVSDQSAGKSVAVKSVTLSQKGWVAVRDSDGKTLGAAFFPAGTSTDVSVPLLRATEAGQRYQVLLYYDDGNHNFNLKTEVLVVNADGSVAGTNFSAK